MYHENLENTVAGAQARLSFRPMVHQAHPSISFCSGPRVGSQQVRSARTALSVFHSVFLAPDQLELSHPINGSAGLYVDAINLSAYFHRGLSTFDGESPDGSKKED